MFARERLPNLGLVCEAKNNIAQVHHLGVKRRLPFLAHVHERGAKISPTTLSLLRVTWDIALLCLKLAPTAVLTSDKNGILMHHTPSTSFGLCNLVWAPHYTRYTAPSAEYGAVREGRSGYYQTRNLREGKDCSALAPEQLHHFALGIAILSRDANLNGLRIWNG